MDIAEIGFKADTSDLATANKQLEKLSDTADAAGKSAESFGRDIDKSTKSVDKSGKSIKQLSTDTDGLKNGLISLGQKAAGIFSAVFAVNEIASFTNGLMTAAVEIDRFARLTGTAAGEFQRYAAGARTVGIENDKLADIFKDMRDRVGDFLQTGAGPMADFFEQIAPKVGVTIDQFRELSGPQALQLFYDSLQKAGVSANEMIFYMEAMASDSSLLIPLLQDNGKQFKSLADEAERYGAILSDDVIQAGKELDANLKILDNAVQGLAIQIAGPLLKALANLTTEFIRATREGETFFGALERGLSGGATGNRSDIVKAAQDIERLSAEYGKLQAQINQYSSRGFDVPGELEFRAGKISAELNDARKNYDRLAAELTKPAPPLPEGVAPPGTKPPGTKPPGTKSPAAAKPIEEASAAALEYAAVMQQLIGQQLAAQASTQGLTDVQIMLRDIMASPVWEEMPEAWRVLIGDQVIATTQANELAEATARLNALLAATPTEQLAKTRDDMMFLADAFERGQISVEQYTEAVMRRLGTDIPASVETATDQMKLFAEQAGKNIHDALADFLFDPFSQGVDGMLQSFGTMLQKMAAQAAAQQIMQGIVGWGKENSGSGGWMGAIANIAGMLGSFEGGGYTGSGPRTGGLDGRGGYMAMIHPDESIIDHRRGNSGAPGGNMTTINVTVQGGGNAPDVRRSAAQGAREAMSIMSNAQRYQ